MYGRALIFIFVLLVGLIWGLSQITRQYLSYTNDAYVLSDFVSLAPTVTGKLETLFVDDNDEVGAGEVLFELDARPYAYEKASSEARLERAVSALKSAQDALSAANDRVEASRAVLNDSQDTQARIADLQSQGVATEQRLDDANRNLGEAVADFGAQQAAAVVASDAVTTAQANLALAEAALDLADYNLGQTSVTAPFSGYVPPFTIREGAYLSAGDPVMAVVDDNAWRIVANLPEAHLAYVAPGQPVWLTVSTLPWTILNGTVRSVPRGISRSETQSDPLPYVEPTSSWIRLARRFPVEITIDDAEDIPLFMGANARVLIRHFDAVEGMDTPATDLAQ